MVINSKKYFLHSILEEPSLLTRFIYSKVESITLQPPTHLILGSSTLSRRHQNQVVRSQMQGAKPSPQLPLWHQKAHFSCDLSFLLAHRQKLQSRKALKLQKEKSTNKKNLKMEILILLPKTTWGYKTERKLLLKRVGHELKN